VFGIGCSHVRAGSRVGDRHDVDFILFVHHAKPVGTEIHDVFGVRAAVVERNGAEPGAKVSGIFVEGMRPIGDDEERVGFWLPCDARRVTDPAQCDGPLSAHEVCEWCSRAG
jgi:hypothetical protein